MCAFVVCAKLYVCASVYAGVCKQGCVQVCVCVRRCVCFACFVCVCVCLRLYAVLHEYVQVRMGTALRLDELTYRHIQLDDVPFGTHACISVCLSLSLSPLSL